MLLKLKQNLPAIILFIFFVSLYIYTAAPGVYDGDSGEMAAAVNTLGLAHPTGFPLYMMAGKLFTLLIPLKDVAYQLNIFSALLTSGALVFAYYSLRNLGNSPFSSLTAAFILGLGRNTIWRNGVTINVYSLSFFIALILLFIFSKWRKDQKIKYLYWYGLGWGLSLGTHTTMLIMGIPFLYMVWRSRSIFKSKISNFIKLILITIIPVLQYFYLIFAYKRNGIVTWGSIASWNDFIYYITQRQYEFKMWSRDSSSAVNFFKKIMGLLSSEFTIIFFCVALIGLIVLFKRKRDIFTIILLLIFINIIILLGYGKLDNELFILFRYIFIADLAIVIAIAFGLDSIVENTGALKNKNHLTSLILVILVIIGFQFKYAFADNNRRNNHLVEDTAHNILNTLEPNAIILAYGDPIIGPLWYFQSIGERKDIIIVSAPLVPFKWYIDNLIRRYPDFGDDNLFDGDQNKRIGLIIKNNIQKRPIYAVFNSSTDGALEKEFDFVSQGLLNKMVIKDSINTKEAAIMNKEIWSKYTLRNIDPDFYADNELKVISQTYAIALYRTGLAYYYSGMIDESIDALQKSLDIFPHPKTKENLDFIKNKKISQ